MAKRTVDDGCWRGVGDATPFVPGRPERIPAARSLETLFTAMVCCTRCDLALGRTRVVVGTGPADADLVLIGEAPGRDEDREGQPFVGASGRLLERLLVDNGIDRERVFITNVAACRPPQNRAPKPAEIRAHAPWLDTQLALVQPKVIVTLGRVALNHFVPKGKITELRGVPQPAEREGLVSILLPTLHPAATFRRRELLPDLEADIAQIPALLSGG